MNKKFIIWSIAVGLRRFVIWYGCSRYFRCRKSHTKAIMEPQRLGSGHCYCNGIIWHCLLVQHLAVPLANKIGRKKSLIWIGIIFWFLLLVQPWRRKYIVLCFFRFLSGLSIGASSVVAPVYISEIAPAKYRGRLVISFQLNVVVVF